MLVDKKTRAALKVYVEIIKYIINCNLYLADYDAYFPVNGDAKKCRYLSVTNKFIFFQNSFKLLPYEALLEVCFAMDSLIKLVCFSN